MYTACEYSPPYLNGEMMEELDHVIASEKPPQVFKNFFRRRRRVGSRKPNNSRPILSEGPAEAQNYPEFNLGIYLVHCVKRFEQTLSNINLLKWLLEKFLTQKDINGRDNFGRNCLHYCVIQDKLIFFHLIFPHIFPETIIGLDKYGLCSLHYAIFLDSYPTLEPLAISLKETAYPLDSICLPGRITFLMLAKNLQNDRMGDLLVSLGSSQVIRDTWKKMNPDQWAQIGRRGVYLHSVFLRPENDSRDSLLYLTGRLKKDSRKELGFDPVLTQLYEKGKSADRDKLHDRQLRRLNNAIEVDREPERYHEVLLDLQKQTLALNPDQKQLFPATPLVTLTNQSENEDTAKISIGKLPQIAYGRSHTVYELLRICSEQNTSSFRRRARTPTPPPKTPSPEPNLANQVPMSKSATAKKRLTALAAIGGFTKPGAANLFLNVSLSNSTLGKKKNSTIITEDACQNSNKRIPSAVSATSSRRKISNTRSPKPPVSSPQPGVTGDTQLHKVFDEVMTLKYERSQGGEPSECYSSQQSMESSFNAGSVPPTRGK